MPDPENPRPPSLNFNTSADGFLHDSERRYRLLVNGLLGHAVFMCRADGRIATWNDGARDLLEYSDDEAVGHTLDRLLGAVDDPAGSAQRCLDEARTLGSIRWETWMVRRDGTRFWNCGILTALSDEAGALQGYVCLLRDETAQQKQARALEQAVATAEAANKAKDSFLANVSHEVRTPLSSIALWAKLLKDCGEDDPETAAEAVSAIVSSAEELQVLIDDLFDTARIVAGRLRLNFQRIAPATIVAAAVEQLEPSAREKQLSLATRIDPAVKELRADPVRLQQVLVNLLNNAIKFTPETGRITVELTHHHSDVLIRVQDTGRGIEPELIPHLFERYGQTGSQQTGPGGGLGLGLSIARKLVEAHDGTLTAESAGAGHGTTFTVRLPVPALTIEELEKLHAPSAPPRASARRLNDLRILLVEDSASNRRALTVTLSACGAQITDVATRAEALAELNRGTFDLLISDLVLPDGDGLDLLKQTRAVEARTGRAVLPAVALTAFPGPEVNEQTQQAGFARCLIKPIAPENLIDELAAILRPLEEQEKPGA